MSSLVNGQLASPNDHKLSIAVSVAFVVILPAWYLLTKSDARYVLYLLPAAILLAVLVTHNRALSVHPPGAAAVAFFAVLCVGATLAGGTTPEFTQRDVVFILSYLSVFAVAFKPEPFVAVAMLVGMTIGLVVDGIQDGVNWDINLLKSEGFLESVLAFPLGLLALAFLYRRNWLLTVVTAVLMVIAFERIAVGGFIMAAAAMMVFERLDRPHIERALTFAVMVASMVAALAAREIFDAVSVMLDLENMSANAISLGRADAIIAMERALDGATTAQHLFGMGVGRSDEIVRDAVGLSNPHNDWLKLRFDYGYVGLVAFALMFFSLFRGSRLGLVMLIYTCVLFITDNALVYVFYFIPAAILAKDA